MHNGMGTEGELIGLERPGNSGCVTAEVSAELATTVAHRLVLALAPALLLVYVLMVGDVGTPALDHVPLRIILFNCFLEILLDAAQLKTRSAFAVWQLRYSVFTAGNACKLFYMTIPGLEVFITDGPVNGKSIPHRTLKVVVTPALRLTGP